MARISIHNEKRLIRDNPVIYRVGLWFLCSTLPITAMYMYLLTKFHFNPICTFQDMAQTGIHYEK